MSSKEVELELQLNKFNSTIILYSKLIKRIPKGQRIFGKKLEKIIEKRNECFKNLRTLLKKKYPEMFIK